MKKLISLMLLVALATLALAACEGATTARPTMSPILRNLGLSIRPVTPK